MLPFFPLLLDLEIFELQKVQILMQEKILFKQTEKFWTVKIIVKSKKIHFIFFKALYSSYKHKYPVNVYVSVTLS